MPDRRASDDAGWNRRCFLRLAGLAGGAIFFNTATRNLFAEELIATPRLTEGPFYPDKFPLDCDNDLIIVNDSITPAVGEITHLTGRILTPTGAPVRNAVVEIWQVDNNGVYIHSRDTGTGGTRDKNFQGYGRFLTDSSGAYYFRTIKPVPYPGRTPHIHFGINKNGQRIYTTQLMINGHPQNEGDGVLNSASDPLARETLLVDFKPVQDSKIGELSAHFDIVLGVTPQDPSDGHVHGGIGKSEMRTRGGMGPPGW
jgi:protocatechuate 3,4-dioxygenase, beta subunit